jgi:hypothetical protein
VIDGRTDEQMDVGAVMSILKACCSQHQDVGNDYEVIEDMRNLFNVLQLSQN